MTSTSAPRIVRRRSIGESSQLSAALALLAIPTRLVTGGSRGLGRAIAEAVLAGGHRLVASERNPHRLADLVAATATRSGRSPWT